MTRVIWFTPDGVMHSNPEITNDDYIDHFRNAYAKANPEPEKGTLPLSMQSVFPDGDNRWPCVDGPMDGQGVAKEIQLKKGAGKNKIFVFFPPPDRIYIEGENIKGMYAVRYQNGYCCYVWEDLNGREVRSLDG